MLPLNFGSLPNMFFIWECKKLVLHSFWNPSMRMHACVYARMLSTHVESMYMQSLSMQTHMHVCTCTL